MKAGAKIYMYMLTKNVDKTTTQTHQAIGTVNELLSSQYQLTFFSEKYLRKVYIVSMTKAPLECMPMLLVLCSICN